MITSVLLLFFFYLPVTQMTQRCGSMCSNESHPPSLRFQPSFPSSLYFLLSVVFLLLPVLLVACALVLLLLLDHFQSPAVSANHTVTPLTPLISTALSPPAPPQHPAPQPRSLLPLPVGEERERGWGGLVSSMRSFIPVPARSRLSRLHQLRPKWQLSAPLNVLQMLPIHMSLEHGLNNAEESRRGKRDRGRSMGEGQKGVNKRISSWIRGRREGKKNAEEKAKCTERRGEESQGGWCWEESEEWD